MSDNFEENGSVEAELKKIEIRLIKIHTTLKVSMCFIIVFIITIIWQLLYSPSF